MKQYRSHKIVEAGVVESIAERAFAIHLISGEYIEVPKDFFARGYPKYGDYLVKYAPTENEPDGYLSWSPKAVFEAGYIEI